MALTGQARPQYTEIQAGHHLHALPLGEAGWLFIERLGAEVPAPVLAAIGVVLLRLAHACRACEQHEQLQVLLGQKAAAEAALNVLTKKDMAELKAYAKPPALVELCLKGVMTVLKKSPAWDAAKKELGYSQFLTRLVEFDKELLVDSLLNKMKKYVNDPEYQPDVI